ncbi:MAG: hypothetical protein GY940_18705 [bacterium]|nr:hypothetical protein [bacterium]
MKTSKQLKEPEQQTSSAAGNVPGGKEKTGTVTANEAFKHDNLSHMIRTSPRQAAQAKLIERLFSPTSTVQKTKTIENPPAQLVRKPKIKKKGVTITGPDKRGCKTKIQTIVNNGLLDPELGLLSLNKSDVKIQFRTPSNPANGKIYIVVSGGSSKSNIAETTTASIDETNKTYVFRIRINPGYKKAGNAIKESVLEHEMLHVAQRVAKPDQPAPNASDNRNYIDAAQYTQNALLIATEMGAGPVSTVTYGAWADTKKEAYHYHLYTATASTIQLYLSEIDTHIHEITRGKARQTGAAYMKVTINWLIDYINKLDTSLGTASTLQKGYYKNYIQRALTKLNSIITSPPTFLNATTYNTNRTKLATAYNALNLTYSAIP